MLTKIYTTKAKQVLCVLIAALGILFAISVLPYVAFAKEAIDTTRSLSILIDTTKTSTAIESASFSLYKVADVESDGSLSITSDFQSYPISFNALSQDDYQKLALTLAGYISRDGIAPVVSGTTNTSGQLSIDESHALKAGMYLLVGQSVKTKDALFTHKPTLVFLPSLHDDNTTWNYTPVIYPKYDVQTTPTTSFAIQKVWKDEGQKQTRPTSIVVDVMCDGVVYDSVVLSEQNTWRASFDNLDASKSWTVAEKSVSGYTTQVRFESQTYVIENTSDTPQEPNKPGEPNKPSQTLPKTGMVVWPIFVFGALGVGLLGLSRKIDKK